LEEKNKKRQTEREREFTSKKQLVEINIKSKNDLQLITPAKYLHIFHARRI
jgi:hypothetical protein